MDRAAGLRRGGVIEAYDTLTRDEDLGKTGVLLLSGGDMWTGPYETTVLEGEPMVAAFNVLGYSAAAVGNHEFDFGTRVLEKRMNEARFPFLAANLREAASGTSPPWARPSTVVKSGGLTIGLVGLTHALASETTDPRHLVGLEFVPYEAALRAEVANLRKQNVDMVVALLHDRLDVARELVPVLRELGINIIAVGHAHRSNSFVDDGGTPGDPTDDVVACNAGAYLRSYCRIDITVNEGVLLDHRHEVKPIARPLDVEVENPEPRLVSIVEAARERSSKVGGELLTEAPEGMKREDQNLGQFIVDTWLAALPYAQVAITNAGGIRQDLDAGPVHVRDIVGVMPFNNYLLVVEMTGAELKTVLANPESIAAGVRYTYRETKGERTVQKLTDAEGRAIADNAKLKVVINDFMYRGGDRYTIREIDGEPEETAIDWREPVLRHLRSLGKNGQPLVHRADDRARKVP